MITCLSALASLERLSLGFQCNRPNLTLIWNVNVLRRQARRALSLPLSRLQFRGVSEYMDDFVARIDAPRLSKLHIILFNQIDFDTPDLPNSSVEHEGRIYLMKYILSFIMTVL